MEDDDEEEDDSYDGDYWSKVYKAKDCKIIFYFYYQMFNIKIHN